MSTVFPHIRAALIPIAAAMIPSLLHALIASTLKKSLLVLHSTLLLYLIRILDRLHFTMRKCLLQMTAVMATLMMPRHQPHGGYLCIIQSTGGIQSCAGTTGCAECPYPLKHILRIADSASLHNGVNHVKAIAETLSKTQLDGDEEGTPATEDAGTPATDDAGNTNPLPNSPAMSQKEAMARAYVQERNLSPSQHTVTF